MLYKPWRRGIERNRERDIQQQLPDDKEPGTVPKLQETLPDLDTPRRDRETPTTAEDKKEPECSRSGGAF